MFLDVEHGGSRWRKPLSAMLVLAMSCGTVGAIGSIRPAGSFAMDLFGPRTERRLCHNYAIEVLPEVA